MMNNKVIKAIKKVGAYQEKNQAEAADSLDTKKHDLDYVTKIDKKSDKKIRTIIQQEYPDDAIITEEGEKIKGENNMAWYVDPLDGTSNYIRNDNIYAISLARLEEPKIKNNTPDWKTAAVKQAYIYLPKLDIMYTAKRNKGAYKNGTRITSSNTDQLEEAVVVLGRSAAKDNKISNVIYRALLPELRDIRQYGCAAYHLVTVASGIVDGVWTSKLNTWDIAAGGLIAQEAGCKIEHPKELNHWLSGRAVIAPPGIHYDFLFAIRNHIDDWPAPF